MYPTLLIGSILIVTSSYAALFPQRVSRPIVRRLAILTGLVSFLGFVTGVITSLIALGSCKPYDATVFALVGIGESLVNIALGLLMLSVAVAVSCLGSLRGRSPAAVLADPHGH